MRFARNASVPAATSPPNAETQHSNLTALTRSRFASVILLGLPYKGKLKKWIGE